MVLAHAWTSFSDDEVFMWLELEAALRKRGARLLLSAPATAAPPTGFPVPVLRFPVWLESTPSSRRLDKPHEPVATGVDLDAVVSAERCWQSAPGTGGEALEHRWRCAANDLAGFYHTLCAAVRPAAALVWNGWHGVEVVLRAVLNQWRCPVWFAERGPFPGTLFIDPEGISTDSRFVRRKIGVPSGARGSIARANFRKISEAHDPAAHTWWTQPAPRLGRDALRERLGVPAGALVVLFAAQVDEDTQAFRFSPLFRRNSEALRWLVDQLPRDGSVFLLGKHHPRSARPAAEFAEIVGTLGQWTTDVGLADALAAADRVAAVNSSVLFEAALSGLPVLSLGRSLATGRGCFHEVSTLASGPRIVRAWLAARNAEATRQRFEEMGASLISHGLFAMHSRLRAAGLPTPGDFANRIAGRIKQHVRKSADPGLNEPERWLIAHWNGAFETGPAISRSPGDRRLDPREARLMADLWRAAAESAHRPVWIWGAGSGGRNLCAALRGLGGKAIGFLDSDPSRMGTRMMDLPVDQPGAVLGQSPAQRPLVVVASVFSAQIAAALDQAGWIVGRDYLVVDVECLARRQSAASVD